MLIPGHDSAKRALFPAAPREDDAFQRAFACMVAVALTSILTAATPYDINVTDVSSGKPVRLRPAPAVLHVAFFATWCPPCLEELAQLAELEARWSDGGYRLAIVAVRGRHDLERLREFAGRRQVPGQFVWDHDDGLRRALDVQGVPAHVLLAPDGAVIERSARLGPALESAIEQEVRKRLRRAPRE